jgi:hypothetical protein
MVDMGGIDLAEANDTEVPGIYEKILEAVNACGDVILYNWKFASIEIAPSHCSILNLQDSFLINGMIQVTELDKVTVLAIEPPPPPIEPVIPLSVDDNGVYSIEPPQSGYNPVTVNLQLSPLSVVENGTYLPENPVRGFSSVVVDVLGASNHILILDTFDEPLSISGVSEGRRVTGLIDGVVSYLMLPSAGTWQVTCVYEEGTTVKNFTLENSVSYGKILPPYTISDLKEKMAETAFARLSNNSSDKSDFNGRWFQRSTNEPIIVCNYRSTGSSYYSYCWLTFSNTAPAGTNNSYGNLTSGGNFSVDGITVYMWVMGGMWNYGNPTYTLDSASVTLDNQTVGSTGILNHQAEMESFIKLLYNILQEE